MWKNRPKERKLSPESQLPTAHPKAAPGQTCRTGHPCSQTPGPLAHPPPLPETRTSSSALRAHPSRGRRARANPAPLSRQRAAPSRAERAWPAAPRSLGRGGASRARGDRPPPPASPNGLRRAATSGVGQRGAASRRMATDGDRPGRAALTPLLPPRRSPGKRSGTRFRFPKRPPGSREIVREELGRPAAPWRPAAAGALVPVRAGIAGGPEGGPPPVSVPQVRAV